MTQIPIPGIILAAGRSLRMGKNKLLLSFHGKPILQHVLDTAQQSSLSPLILVLGSKSDLVQAQITPGRVIIVENPSFLCGYGSSLQVGLKALSEPCAGAMFLLGDQPLLITKTINRLILAFQEEPERWVAPSWSGLRGNPVIIPVSWFARIFALKGDTGPREHLSDPAANLKLVDVDDRGVVLDIDTPEDYEQLKKI